MNSHVTDPTHEVFLYQNCDKLPASAIRRKAFDPWATSQDAADFPHDPPITAKGISLNWVRIFWYPIVCSYRSCWPFDTYETEGPVEMGRKMPEARVWFEYVKEVHGQLGPEFRQASESEYKPTTRLSTDLGTCSTHTDSYLCTDLYSLCTYLWYACIYALTETSSQASDLFRTDSLTGMKSDKPRTC